MPPVEGFLPILALGVLGAALHEGMKVFAAWKDGRALSSKDIIGALVFAALGALVPVVWGTEPRPFLEIAQLGVGIPALVSGGFRIATSGDGQGQPNGGGADAQAATGPQQTSTPQFLGWRF